MTEHVSIGDVLATEFKIDISTRSPGVNNFGRLLSNVGSVVVGEERVRDGNLSLTSTERVLAMSLVVLFSTLHCWDFDMFSKSETNGRANLFNARRAYEDLSDDLKSYMADREIPIERRSYVKAEICRRLFGGSLVVND